MKSPKSTTSATVCLFYILTSFAPVYARAGDVNIPSKPAPGLTQEDLDIIFQAKLQAYVNFFNQNIHSGKDIELGLFSSMKDQHKAEARPYWLKAGNAPKLKRNGSTLEVHFEKGKMQISWPKLNEPQTVVDGISWTFDPTASFKWQVETLTEKMRKAAAATGDKSALYNFLFPNAHAIAPAPVVAGWSWAACQASTACWWAVTAVGGAVIGGFLGGMFNDIKEGSQRLLCYSMRSYKPWESVGWCRWWKNERDLGLRGDLTEAATHIDRDPNRLWVPSNPECPATDKNGEGKFQAWMLEINNSKGPDPKPEGNWFLFQAKSKDGNFTEAYVFHEKDKIDGDPKENAAIQYIFTNDKKPILRSIKFRNPAYDPKADPGATRYITVFATDKPAELPPTIRDRVPKQAAFLEAAQEWAKTCRNLAYAAKFDRTKAQEATKAMTEQPATIVPTMPANRTETTTAPRE